MAGEIRDTDAPVQSVSGYRSGAVARMLRMPVATLRVWERRYAVTQPALSPGGQRLYSNEDVRRLTLLKQLTEMGHAIGSLARLDMAQLQKVASMHAGALVATKTGDHNPRTTAVPERAWRLAVIGTTLGARLQRPDFMRRLGRSVVVLGPFDSAAQAAAALRPSSADAVLIQEPNLLEGWHESFVAVAPVLAALPTAVFYRFSAEPVCDALADVGICLLREPQPDAVLAQWISRWAGAAGASATGTAAAHEPTSPRRWTDLALADFARVSSTIACECPRHVAELLLQLTQFEEYSASCENRNAQDAELHSYLRQVAAASRARFESALEYVAMYEGLILPP